MALPETMYPSPWLSNTMKAVATVFLLTQCDLIEEDRISEENDWLIPTDEIMDGGPGQDGIPSIDSPNFKPAMDINYVDNSRLVLGIKEEGKIRAYPHQVMDFHEIVNDRLGDKPIAVTHCPLTGTGIGWVRSINGLETEFGVSGLLFRNNLIAYDRQTESYWPQMQLRAAQGDLKDREIKTAQVIETTWATWQQVYPRSEVLTTDTGFSRNYTGFAYGQGYLANHGQILFPIMMIGCPTKRVSTGISVTNRLRKILT